VNGSEEIGVRRWTPWRIVVIAVVGVLALMWMYVLFIAKPLNPDRLSDRRFPTEAESVCATAVKTLESQGLVNQRVDTPQQRADLVRRANVVLQDMVGQLRDRLPPPGDERDALSKWLDDWDQWLRDRAAWAAELDNGENAQFNEKQRSNGEPNSKALNDFAVVNEMGSCQTPAGI